MGTNMTQQAQSKQQGPVAPVAQPDILIMPSMPGVRRDGTPADADYFNDAQWTRFVRNRPRKMGGYQEISPLFSGPVHAGFLWSRQFMNVYCAFSSYGVEFSYVDNNGTGSVVTPITPAGFVTAPNILWSYDYTFDAASGADATLLVATPMHTLQNIDDPTLGNVYVTPLNNPAVMTQVADVKAVASGGLFCTAPYTVLLGNDGNVTWSDANSPQNYTAGDAGNARVTGSKLVKGLPMRTGISSGGLLWSLDSVIRMDWVGGSAIFKFSHISTKSSILSQRSVIEYDGKWYWVGIDRFMTTNGVVVEELPNEMNLNWFFDNLNFEQRQKVFAMKMPRFGEIWWLFPFGESAECNKAVIYNLRSKTWYDTDIDRSFGFTPATYRYPVMTDAAPNMYVSVALVVSTGTLADGDYIVGITSGAECAVMSRTGTGPYVALTTKVNTKSFLSGEGFVDITSGATGTIGTWRNLYSVFSHEKGYNAVIGRDEVAIPAHFTTCDLGLPTGGSVVNAQKGINLNTRLTRVEPDFVMTQDMTMEVLSKQFAQSAEVVSSAYPFSANTGKIDVREQVREFRLKFASNKLGGFFEGGKTLIHIEPGDARA